MKEENINKNMRGTWEDFLDYTIIQLERQSKRIDKIKKIIELRNKNKMTLQEIGDKIGYTKENIRLILKKFKL